MVSLGILTLGPSWFITLTFRQGKGMQRDAQYVQDAFRRFLRLLKKRHPQRYRGIAYLRVPELTKKSQPHLHLLMHLGGNEPPLHTWDAARPMQLEMRKIWQEVTHDSFMVWVTPCYNPEGGATYLAKYFSKTFGQREKLEALGFLRRYARSRLWPNLSVRMRGGSYGPHHTPAYYRPSNEEIDRGRSAKEFDLVAPGAAGEILSRDENKKRLGRLAWLLNQ